ncbi:hypothetical protein NITUZ_60194 [Candidatus Nitrosotenuis uzonensis]|uniref:Uncharacterized protein n=1 Tax=Candidatus Nitrosotenuis uzonensis TaxID=1407055 RepID=V6AVP8_9ARCH|nr:hypothetical protein NITUZ_60194 [Candidatus Nitrosotenuis uzonensis]
MNYKKLLYTKISGTLVQFTVEPIAISADIVIFAIYFPNNPSMNSKTLMIRTNLGSN